MNMIDLIYDADCPNVESARAQIRKALADAELPEQWREWERSMPDAPDFVRRYGSPTILVNGSDVAGLDADADASCCRVYIGEGGGMTGVPSVEAILAALRRQPSGKSSGESPLSARMNRLAPLAAIPAIVSSMLPMFGCPACWPAYAGVLGALGISVAGYTTYMLPLTLLFLVVALISPAREAWKRKRYGGLLLGISASTFIIVGTFILESSVMAAVGILLLIGASLHARSDRRRECADESCSACSVR